MIKIFIIFFSFISLFANNYILNSEVNIKRYKELKLDIWDYEAHLKLLKNFINKQGYTAQIISEKELKNLKKNDVLFVIDSFAISKKAQNEIINFVANGGKIVFNFKSAFLDEKGNLTQKSFLEKITGLKSIGFGIPPKGHVFFVISKLLSPIITPKRLDFTIYDTLPLFTGKKPYLEFTNWAITEPLRHNGKYIPSGVLWSGKYKKGGWIYFNFPFYIFANKDLLAMGWQNVIDSMIDYVIRGISIVKYPYLKYDKMVFISEDTEYKYVNFNNFINALKKYDLNGTAFCVGKLARLHPELMDKAGNLPFLEVASHSYSHTKLIDKPINVLDKVEINGNDKLLQSLSHQETKGFRPPREELNQNIIKVIETSSLNYVLAKNLSQLQPKYLGKLMLISRIGTDDYQYLMELDWNKTQIINNMKREVDYITHLNGIYTLSTHTHLMCYKSNIKILEGLLAYVKQKKYPTLKGKDIVNLIFSKDNIKVSIKDNQIEIYNNNNKLIKEFVFRIYFLTNIPTKIRCALKTKLIKNRDYIDIKVFDIKPKQKFKVMLINE